MFTNLALLNIEKDTAEDIPTEILFITFAKTNRKIGTAFKMCNNFFDIQCLFYNNKVHENRNVFYYLFENS